MKKIIASVAVAAFAALGMASAHADAPTLTLSGGSAVFGLDPAIITGEFPAERQEKVLERKLMTMHTPVHVENSGQPLGSNQPA